MRLIIVLGVECDIAQPQHGSHDLEDAVLDVGLDVDCSHGVAHVLELRRIVDAVDRGDRAHTAEVLEATDAIRQAPRASAGAAADW